MYEIGVVGLSYRNAGAEEVARFALPKAEVPARLAGLREALGAAEVVYLGTCNRVEVIFAAPPGVAARDCREEVFHCLTGRAPRAGEAPALLRAWMAEAALEHLFLVACGLDSAQAGEQEIAVQLRAAWDTARAAQVSGPTLDRVLGEALAMARQAHRLEMRGDAPSLADLAVERIVEHLSGRGGSVALVGVSPMTRRSGRRLHERGVPLTVVNRSPEAARELAAELAADVLSLEEFCARPAGFAAIACATGGAEPVLTEPVLARLAAAGGREVLLVDFGLPPNVDLQAVRRLGLKRIGMNELVQAARDNRLAQLIQLAPVRAAIDERLARLRSDLAARAIGPQLQRLREDFERITAVELEELLGSQLRTLDPGQRDILCRWAATLARRLAHLPVSGLRAAAEHASAETVDAFFREARLSRERRRNSRS